MDSTLPVVDDGEVFTPDPPDRFLSRLLHLDDSRVRARTALSGSAADGTPTLLSHRQLAEAATAVADRLAAAGVQVGDRVAIVGDHGPHWVAGLLGVLARGAVAVPLDRGAGAAGLAALLRDADPAFVLFGPNDEDQVRAGLARAGNTAPAAPLAAVSAPGPGTAPRPPTVSRRTDDTAIIMYTSGTTGTPKGVEVSWANLAYQVTVISGRQGVPPDAVFISVLPPHHLLELVAGCLAPLYLGSRLHYPGSLLPADIVAAITALRATDLVVVPLLLAALRRWLDAELAEHEHRRPSWLALGRSLAPYAPWPIRRFIFGPVHARLGGRLRRFFCGGAPLDPELARYFHRLGFSVCQGYGLSEASPVVAANTPRHNRFGSVGRLLPGTEVRLGGDGELSVRGPGVMRGYWRRPAQTAAAIDEGGWLRTGDSGFVDADGYLFVTGRVTDLIVLPNGENVHPAEIESVLETSALFSDVCAVGRPGPRGEEIVVVVTPDDAAPTGTAPGGDRALVGEVRRLVAGLAAHKRPNQIVVRGGRLPRTSVGKIRRDRVAALLATPE